MLDVVHVQDEALFLALAAKFVQPHTLDVNVMPTVACVDAPSGNLTITEAVFIVAIA